MPGVNMLRKLHWDSWLFGWVSLLLAVSFVLLYSASGQKIATMMKHGIHVLLGFGVFIVVAQMSPRTFKQWAPILYGVGIILLVSVFLIGATSKGAQRWINLSIIRFQPSELMKLLVPLMLAYYLGDQPLPLRKTPVFISLIIIFVPGLLIAKQPDLGTALLVIATGFGVLFFAGIRWQWILKMSAVVFCALPFLWWKLHDYQRQRVLTFLNPERDPLGSGYHIIQSKIAIGSGGLYGRGWCQGTQAQLNFLPERTTDFIFSVLGEEFGFIGVSILCLLYFAVFVRGIMIMTQTQSNFNRLLAGGIIFGFFICFFINIGMVSGLLPVVGCPLPLISYGGTSMMTWMAAFGILVAIQCNPKSLQGS
ncbi:MAG: rod shape-determining protein RodA [Candidatus Berkiellales bacterium]